jgi:putative two-component system response regulator
VTDIDNSLKYTILVVDDTPLNLSIISDVLKEKYKIKVANNGEKALKIANGDKIPDLILLDIMMTGMDGYEVCRKLKQMKRTKDIPVIFLTAMTNQINEKAGFDVGAVDYITKPISIPILLARVESQLKLKEARDFLKDKNEYLEAEVKRRTREADIARNLVIFALASLAEIRDYETGNHIKRTNLYVSLLALQLSKKSNYRNTLTEKYIDLIYRSASLHDIGKIGISDNILLKPGKLTEDEFEIMKTHTTLGRDAITKAEQHIKQKVEMLECAKRIAYSHHEKWDGSGYPEGLSGENIPLCGRIMAVADVYDALRSKRVYKPSFSHEKVVSIITNDSGTHFDPEIVEAFLEIKDKYEKISYQYADKE